MRRPCWRNFGEGNLARNEPASTVCDVVHVARENSSHCGKYTNVPTHREMKTSRLEEEKKINKSYCYFFSVTATGAAGASVGLCVCKHREHSKHPS